MSRLSRRAALGSIIVGSILFISDTVSFSRITGDRSVEVNPASDKKALLALSGVNTTATDPHKVTVTNQTSGNLINNTVKVASGEIRVKKTKNGDSSTSISPGSLGPGEAHSFFVVAASADDVSGKITFDYSGQGTDITLTRDVGVRSFKCADLTVDSSGEAIRVVEDRGDKFDFVEETANENENENESDDDSGYSYTYDYCYRYKQGRYRYTYQYRYEYSESAKQDPSPDPSPNPRGEPEPEPDPEPDPEPG